MSGINAREKRQKQTVTNSGLEFPNWRRGNRSALVMDFRSRDLTSVHAVGAIGGWGESVSAWFQRCGLGFPRGPGGNGREWVGGRG